MISIAITRTPAHAPTADDLAEVVGWTRRDRVRRTRSPQDQWHRILADRLLADLLTSRGATGHDYAPNGRPIATDLFVSASHDGAAVVAAVGTTPIGIDVVDATRFESRHEAPAWAAMEAVTKRWGIGLALNPRRLHIRPTAPGAWQVIAQDGRAGQAWVSRLGRRHLLAVSGAGVDRPPLADQAVIPARPHIVLNPSMSRPERRAA